MKIAFAGTPEFAAVALETILHAGMEVSLVLTQPDRPAGRGMQLQASPVKQLALANNIPVDQPERLKTLEQQERLRQCAPDVLVVAAYGLILPQVVLDIPTKACLNIHASLLPRWRGAAPIHRAIEAGDAESGITIMQMEAGLDTGPMVLRQAIPIQNDDTTATLHDRLAELGGKMIVDVLQNLSNAPLQTTPQPEQGVTYAHKVGKPESQLDFRLDAASLDRKLRAFTPFPGGAATVANTALKIWGATIASGNGEPGQILAVDSQGVLVACGTGALRLTILQKPGSRRLPAADFLRGFPLQTGQKFDLPETE